MNGQRLREQRLQAGIGYRRLARATSDTTSRLVAIERSARVTDDVAIRFMRGLAELRAESSRAQQPLVRFLVAAE
jgi:transcriptional regulator with XRE-family HTH domain